jgi:hypothetical protein
VINHGAALVYVLHRCGQRPDRVRQSATTQFRSCNDLFRRSRRCRDFQVGLQQGLEKSWAW